MKITFDEIHHCSKVAFATLLNATRLLATQNSVGEAFHDHLFQQCQKSLILALKVLFLYDPHQIRT